MVMRGLAYHKCFADPFKGGISVELSLLSVSVLSLSFVLISFKVAE